MPIGQRPGGAAVGPSVGPRLVAGAGYGPDGPPPDLPGRLGAVIPDLWQHFAYSPADLADGEMIHAAGEFSKIAVMVRDPVPVYVGLGRSPTSDVGEYDLVHPGDGLLVFVVPSSSTLGVVADAGLTNPVDFWLMAGSYDIRMS